MLFVRSRVEMGTGWGRGIRLSVNAGGPDIFEFLNVGLFCGPAAK